MSDAAGCQTPWLLPMDGHHRTELLHCYAKVVLSSTELAGSHLPVELLLQNVSFPIHDEEEEERRVVRAKSVVSLLPVKWSSRSAMQKLRASSEKRLEWPAISLLCSCGC